MTYALHFIPAISPIRLTRSLIHHDLRLALHPGDITDKKLMAVSEDCIRHLLDAGYISKSYNDLIQPELSLVC